MELKSIQVIVSRYREDVSWVRSVNLPLTIYNKGDDSTALEDAYTVITRPNMGREGETFLHHIIEHYDTLPEHLVMLQGNPFDHAHNVISILNDIPRLPVLVAIGTNWKYESLEADFNWPGFKEALVQMADILSVPHDAFLRYSTGAQYIVPRELIVARPRAFYESLLLLLNTEVNPLSGWALERLWPYVFGSKLTSTRMHIARLGEMECSTLGELALNSEDYVVILNESTEIRDQDIARALGAYPILKAQFRMEDDLLLGLAPTEWGTEGGVRMQSPSCSWVQVAGAGAFLTHRSVLLQHFALLERTEDISKFGEVLARERHLPLLAPAQ